MFGQAISAKSNPNKPSSNKPNKPNNINNSRKTTSSRQAARLNLLAAMPISPRIISNRLRLITT